MLKKIQNPIVSQLLSLDSSALSFYAYFSGKEIKEGHAPLIGRYLVINNQRIISTEPSHPDLVFAYKWAADHELICIYIGSDLHGPLLSWRIAQGWRNLYGHGNHGNNGACGGRWSASAHRTYPTINAAIAERDYLVGGIPMHRSRLLEGPAIIEALLSLEEIKWLA